MPEPILSEPQLPFSKSLTARALCLNLMSDTTACLCGGERPKEAFPPFQSEAGDVRVLSTALEQVLSSGAETALSDKTELDAGDSGTALRFLTACLSLRPGRWILKGSPRLCERPMRPLLEALRACGADIRCLGQEGFAPLEIHGKALKGGEVELDASCSSQFLSALMMAAPLMKAGLTLHLVGPTVSRPYAEMTASMMEIWGVTVDWKENVTIAPQVYRTPAGFMVERDWSSASCWFECQAIDADLRMVLRGLSPHSLQGDACLPELFTPLGVKSEFKDGALYLSPAPCRTDYFEADMSSCPDLVPAVAMTCASKALPFRLSGIGHLRFKESDRLAALVEALRLLGYEASAGNDSLTMALGGNNRESDLAFRCRCDHRISMALAPLALHRKLHLYETEGVDKSYPGFWNEMRRLLKEKNRDAFLMTYPASPGSENSF